MVFQHGVMMQAMGLSTSLMTWSASCKNLYNKGKENRTMNSNSQYLVVFKNPRDWQQLVVLARQMYPNKCYKRRRWHTFTRIQWSSPNWCLFLIYFCQLVLLVVVGCMRKVFWCVAGRRLAVGWPSDWHKVGEDGGDGLQTIAISA